LLHAALDAGYDFLDTAALYGFGGNETLIGETLAGRRGEYLLASKCGMAGVDGKRVIDGRPATIMATVEASLQRLKTDVIDLLYLHRRDFAVPIEETVGAMAALVQAGKVRMMEIYAPVFRPICSITDTAWLDPMWADWLPVDRSAMISRRFLSA
jgi:aryl-alcohol dehydrogenase-like predicted oxidoreductase